MKILLYPTLFLVSCASSSAQVIGTPYSVKGVLSSPFCQHARCQAVRTTQVGDKFGPANEQVTVSTYALKPGEPGLSAAELSARVQPNQKLDLMRLSFTVPKKSGVRAAAPLIAQWLKLLGLPAGAATACLNSLGRETFVPLRSLPKTVEGGCTAYEDRPGFLNVTFSVGRPTAP